MLRIAASRSARSSLLLRSLATHTAIEVPIAAAARHDWTKEEVKQIYDTPLLDLVFRSAWVHRQHHDPSKIQLCTLMNIKSEFYFCLYEGLGCVPFFFLTKSDLQVGAVAKIVRSLPIDADQGRAHVHQVHTARSRRDTRLPPRLLVS